MTVCRFRAAARARAHSIGIDVLALFQVVLGLQVIQGDVMKLDPYLPYFDICVANIPYQVHVLVESFVEGGAARNCAVSRGNRHCGAAVTMWPYQLPHP